MMYKTDENGEYRATEKWVDAWTSQAPGFARCELREYADGAMRVHRDDAIYLVDSPEYVLQHALLLLANKHFGI